MIHRPYWVTKIDQAWGKKSLVWLAGVRRVGKTTIAKMFPNAVYMNCDLPSVTRRLEDPESYFRGLPDHPVVIFDEVHRLDDPSRLLKIGTDEFPDVRILATGSSTLEASRKFSDSLTGRKIVIYLPPVLWDECDPVFHIPDLDRRLLHGGLPEELLSDSPDHEYYAEWMESYFARDIQHIFEVRNRAGFIGLMELLFRYSGQIISQVQLSRECGLTRPTVNSYLEALHIAHAIFLLRPFSGGGKREITRQPKCYAFDTGFVAFTRGWHDIRLEDRGILWEHLVLDMIRSHFLPSSIFYWRDKSGREIDFVLRHSSGRIDVIEAKVNPGHFSGASIREFRAIYPEGINYCFSPYTTESYTALVDGLAVKFAGRIEHFT